MIRMHGETDSQMLVRELQWQMEVDYWVARDPLGFDSYCRGLEGLDPIRLTDESRRDEIPTGKVVEIKRTRSPERTSTVATDSELGGQAQADTRPSLDVSEAQVCACSGTIPGESWAQNVVRNPDVTSRERPASITSAEGR